MKKETKSFLAQAIALKVIAVSAGIWIDVLKPLLSDVVKHDPPHWWMVVQLAIWVVGLLVYWAASIATVAWLVEKGAKPPKIPFIGGGDKDKESQDNQCNRVSAGKGICHVNAPSRRFKNERHRYLRHWLAKPRIWRTGSHLGFHPH